MVKREGALETAWLHCVSISKLRPDCGLMTTVYYCIMIPLAQNRIFAYIPFKDSEINGSFPYSLGHFRPSLAVITLQDADSLLYS